MPSPESRIIIACAGSGKTTRLVDDALKSSQKRIAVVTYTNNNARAILKKFARRNSGLPRHVDVMTWFGFILRECARPYQSAVYPDKRIESLLFVTEQSTRYVSSDDTRRYYFASDELLYSDKAARFVVQCEEKSNGAVTDRLRQIYSDVFIDEFQDLAGWDLELIKLLLQSGIRVTLVGDPRQHIYSTNASNKHRRHQGIGVIELLEQWQNEKLCSVEFMNTTHRCNGPICEFSNALWQHVEGMTPVDKVTTGHDGLFSVAEKHVAEYLACFGPQVLHYDKRAKVYSRDDMNFGLAKGLEFDRILVVPTEPMRKYLRTGVLDHVKKSRDKLYVAVTRARHSVAFVYEGISPIVPNRWNP